VGRRRWLARLSLLLMGGAVAIVIVFADRRGVLLVIVGTLGACAQMAGAYWFLAHRGVPRWAGFAVVILAPAAVVVAYVWRGLLWVAVLVITTGVLAIVAGRAALGRVTTVPAPGLHAERPRRAFVIINPRSGDGKGPRFRLQEKAEALGAQVVVLDGPAITDVVALARRAVAAGADLLGVAGGDGTQALVAGVAAEHDLPFLCISAGTRNHFAMDLGLDRADPSGCLDALTDGVEYRIDLGQIAGRTFVNNASFGVYAEVVRSPAYREDKRRTTLAMLPDLLKSDEGNRLCARAGGMDIDGPQALLVSNNAYETADLAGLGRRPRLDGGTLGVIALTVYNTAEAISLVRRGRGTGLTLASADEVIVESGQPEIPVGIDGETVMLPTPVRCVIMPKVLRVVVPRSRPGTTGLRPAFRLAELARLAAFTR
jgi:diacylglycerol kinase family enzyme